MEKNQSLINRLRKLPSDVQTEFGVESLIQDYDTACKISQGRDVKRALHWESLATDYLLTINKLLKEYTV